MTRRLYIASENNNVERPVAEWEVFDAIPGPGIDHVGDFRKLARFEDNTFEEIYASHVLQHISYRKESMSCLEEWKRVLVPGGVLHIAVPDMTNLCQLFLREDLSDEERMAVMRILFGGQITMVDLNLGGWWEKMLELYLTYAGYEQIERLVDMPYGLRDATAYRFKDVPTSLNMKAVKPNG